jgi:hypothetical protein
MAPVHQLSQLQIEGGKLAADQFLEPSEFVFKPLDPPGHPVFNPIQTARQIVDPLSQLVRTDPHSTEADDYRARRADQRRYYLTRHFAPPSSLSPSF